MSAKIYGCEVYDVAIYFSMVKLKKYKLDGESEYYKTLSIDEFRRLFMFYVLSLDLLSDLYRFKIFQNKGWGEKIDYLKNVDI